MTKTEAAQIEGEVIPAAKQTAVATRSRKTAPAQVDPMLIYQMAVEKGSDIAVIKQTYELIKDVERNNAIKAYNAAIADVRPHLPVIIKNRRVQFESKRGGADTDYVYEDLAQIAEQVDPVLAEYGLSYRYRARQNGNALTIICVISHRDGHMEEVELTSVNDLSGNKNPTQGVGSTATFLQRYTLKLGLGLAAAPDDDARSAGPAPKPTVPRASASNGSAQASAAQAQPTRQQTSNISSGHQGPIKIVPLAKETYSAWSLRFVAAIKTANSVEEIEQWDQMNNELLDEIFNKAKPVYVEINTAMKKQKQAVSGGGKPPADPPAGSVTGASIDMPDEPWAKWEIPNAEKDYESFLSYVGDKLNSWTEDHGDIEAFWNTIIEPAETFPGDKDDLLSLYRKAEARLGG